MGFVLKEGGRCVTHRFQKKVQSIMLLTQINLEESMANLDCKIIYLRKFRFIRIISSS
jgi:hypothetical protein